MGDYVKTIGRDPLMTVEEEINCGRLVQAMAPLLGRDPSTFNKEEQLIYKRGMRARDRFVKGNMRMVMSVARRNMGIVKFLDFEDLCQEGMLGLQRAAEKFDPARGYKFSTYSYWWIRQSIGRAIQTTDRTVRMPINVLDALTKLRKYQEEQARIGRIPTREECMEHIEMKEAQFQSALVAYMGTASTDTTILDDDNKSLLDTLVDPATDTIIESVEKTDTIYRLRCALDALPEDKRMLIVQYYGLDGHPSMPLSAIGKKHRVSREAIRQRLSRATLALRRIYSLTNGPIVD